MTFEELSEWTIRLGAKEKLLSEVRQRVSRELPSFVREIEPKTAPKRVASPSDSPVGNLSPDRRFLAKASSSSDAAMVLNRSFGIDFSLR